MHIHLGNDFLISSKDIITIINIENNKSSDLRDIIDTAEIEKKLINVSNKEKKKSLIICNDYYYVSPISSGTLYKRAINYYKEV